jgi:hypothetical protein
MTLAQQRAHEERELQNRNNMARTHQKEAIRQQQMQQAEKNFREAERLKQERQQHEEMISMQKHAEELKAKSMK